MTSSYLSRNRITILLTFYSINLSWALVRWQNGSFIRSRGNQNPLRKEASTSLQFTSSTRKGTGSITCSWKLYAKKKKISGKKKANKIGGKGFGGSKITQQSLVIEPVPTRSKSTTLDTEDYAVFPPLEPSVKETLIASNDVDAVGELTEDIYARIGYVHGFPRFNYLSNVEEQDEVTDSISFDDLLTDSKSPSSSLLMENTENLLSLSDMKSSTLGKNSNDDVLSAMGFKGDSDTDKESVVPSQVNVGNIPPFENFRVLHVDPLVIVIENFFTDEECDKYIALSKPDAASDDGGTVVMTRSKTVGKDKNALSQRTSTTWFHEYRTVPELMAKSARLFGIDDINQFEEPQTVQYKRSEKFTWHLDAFAPGSNNMSNGAQRTATLLVYLSSLTSECGGATTFRDLGGKEGFPLKMQPKKGSALVFFPSAGGIPNTPFDIRTLHAGEVVSSSAIADKWIAQLWLREKPYLPNVPKGNCHSEAVPAIEEYCGQNKS